ncbi:DUF4297 domain-containing protein [Shimia marina]|uniref:CD-NTase associated protein 4-like DNA endonuclease domain-containing protein n=1 Tax=Shimia marina TaxID=321267 RepID=A0A0P1F9U9_9RHOB|nr:DUF4297 domain-containing protein [Shimia marina]CUH50765.1 hypothetical protein SHM7688_00194 [Shimia marina]SFE65487.1 protein of unknown function [Shimia marina]
MSKLSSKLISTPQLEDSGSDTAKRFQYQALYGLALVFEEHKSGNDYAVVFEFHDDLAVLDSSTVPERVRFFQVKTKASGHWTLTPILKQEKGKGKISPEKLLPSYMGKMYQNVLNFGDSVEAVSFVSNAQMNFGSKSSNFCLDSCTPEEVARVVNQIKKEHPECKDVKTQLVRFVCSSLSLEDLDVHSKGKLSEFVSENLGEMEYSLDALYRAVVDECQRKSRTKCDPKSIPDLLLNRGVTKTDAEAWLTRIRQKASAPAWDEISSEVSGSFFEKNSMRKEWARYGIEALNSNVAIDAVRLEIQNQLNDKFDGEMTLMELVSEIFPEVAPKAREHLSPISDQRIKVMIIYEACI